MLKIPLDDLLALTKVYRCPDVSRSGLDRCLRRHGVGNLRAMLPKEGRAGHQRIKATEPGFFHMDIKYLPQMPGETKRRHPFIAIERTTRMVFHKVMPAKTAACAQRFLKYLAETSPLKVQKILTDNGKEFTDRLFGSREKKPSGEHEFDQLCAALGIEHRLTRPRRPQTNGMVERFNGRIADILRTHHFKDGESLEKTIDRYVWLYNYRLPLPALGVRTPFQAMKDVYENNKNLFQKRIYNHPGLDS